VPAQYKRFIELIFERKAQDAFRDRYAAVLTTSIHFYDHTAHNYMHAVCDDLEMKFAGSFSPGMYDLLRRKERERLSLFAENLFTSVDRGIPASRAYRPIAATAFRYAPGPVSTRVETGDKKVLILTDSGDADTNLIGMTGRFSEGLTGNVEVVNLHSLDIRGGCLGCIQCGYDNTCVYEGKDGYIEFFNAKVKRAEILVLAGTIRDRYLSSRWKLFFDRSFFNNHKPILEGKQVGFIISGPLGQVPNLRQILEAYAEVQGANIVDFVTDESGNPAEIDALLQGMAERLVRYARQGYVKPMTYLGIGGRKVFRDDIGGNLRFPFVADHEYFKKHGFYDNASNRYKKRIANAVMIAMAKIPSVRKEIYVKRMKEEMVKPLRNIVDRS
jgi:multimeric flavodoxin WrbA